MRYALRAMELMQPFLPFGHSIENRFMSILARATSNEHKWNGAEVYTRYAKDEVPVTVKLMAERAAIFHLGLEEGYDQKNAKLTSTKIASRRKQTLVRATYDDKTIGESRVATILVLSDSMGRVNLVVADGEPEVNKLSFVENPNKSAEELQHQFPTAYVVQMRHLMSDSLKRINQLETKRSLKDITEAFSEFAVQKGLSIDSLADPDHTLPDTIRTILSLDINSKIHHLVLEYLDNPEQENFKEIEALVKEANSLNATFSFGGTGRMIHRKIVECLDQVFENLKQPTVLYITNLISLADWLHIYIDKTSIENQAFPMFQEFKKNPKGKLKAMIPVFQWLNFEVGNV
jgi:hypothetical protein